MDVNNPFIIFITMRQYRKMRIGGQLIFMIHLPYHLTLMQIFHHLQQLAEELHEIFLQIFHQAQEVGHGVVVEEEDVVVVEGVGILESKVEVSSKANKESSFSLLLYANEGGYSGGGGGGVQPHMMGNNQQFNSPAAPAPFKFNPPDHHPPAPLVPAPSPVQPGITMM